MRKLEELERVSRLMATFDDHKSAFYLRLLDHYVKIPMNLSCAKTVPFCFLIKIQTQAVLERFKEMQQSFRQNDALRSGYALLIAEMSSGLVPINDAMRIFEKSLLFSNVYYSLIKSEPQQ